LEWLAMDQADRERESRLRAMKNGGVFPVLNVLER